MTWDASVIVRACLNESPGKNGWGSKTSRKFPIHHVRNLHQRPWLTHGLTPIVRRKLTVRHGSLSKLPTSHVFPAPYPAFLTSCKVPAKIFSTFKSRLETEYRLCIGAPPQPPFPLTGFPSLVTWPRSAKSMYSVMLESSGICNANSTLSITSTFHWRGRNISPSVSPPDDLLK